MPLYYLNTSGEQQTFYTDEGSLRNTLAIARGSEYARFTYYLGKDEFTGRRKHITASRVHPDLKLVTDWLPPDLVLKHVLNKHLHTIEFRLEFDSKVVAVMTHHGELIVTMPFGKTDSVLSAFNVPPGVHALLLSSPGTMYSTVKRTGQFFTLGHFITIQDWFNMNPLEKRCNCLLTEINRN